MFPPRPPSLLYQKHLKTFKGAALQTHTHTYTHKDTHTNCFWILGGVRNHWTVSSRSTKQNNRAEREEEDEGASPETTDSGGISHC